MKYLNVVGLYCPVHSFSVFCLRPHTKTRQLKLCMWNILPLTDLHTPTYSLHMRQPIRERLAGQRFINRPITSMLRYAEKESGGNVMSPHLHNIAHAIAVSNGGSVIVLLMCIYIYTTRMSCWFVSWYFSFILRKKTFSIELFDWASTKKYIINFSVTFY